MIELHSRFATELPRMAMPLEWYCLDRWCVVGDIWRTGSCGNFFVVDCCHYFFLRYDDFIVIREVIYLPLVDKSFAFF